jgi:hypothetical protein
MTSFVNINEETPEDKRAGIAHKFKIKYDNISKISNISIDP